jgi:hypothetical protein
LSYAQNGNLNRVKSLLNSGLNINSRNAGESTALIQAAKYGRLSVVRELLNKGANVNLSDTDGRTALMEAAARSSEIVKTLVEKGANINARDKQGRSAIVIAAYNNMIGIVKYLLERGATNTNRIMREHIINKKIKQLIQNKVPKYARPVRTPRLVNLPENINSRTDPVSLKNFNKGNNAVMVTKRWLSQNGKQRKIQYYMEKNTVERLAGKRLNSILDLTHTTRVFTDPLNRRSIMRQNLKLVKFV